MGGLLGFFSGIGRWIKKHKFLAVLIVVVVICVSALIFFPQCALSTFLKGAWETLSATTGKFFGGMTWSGAADVAAKTATTAAVTRTMMGGGNTASPAMPAEPGVAGTNAPPSGWNNIGEAINKVSSTVADKASAYIVSGQAAKDYVTYKGTTSLLKTPNKYLPLIALAGGGLILLSLLKK